MTSTTVRAQSRFAADAPLGRVFSDQGRLYRICDRCGIKWHIGSRTTQPLCRDCRDLDAASIDSECAHRKPHRHGTVAAYTRCRCRCSECRTAWATYRRDLKSRKGEQ